jgi:phage-related protein
VGKKKKSLMASYLVMFNGVNLLTAGAEPSVTCTLRSDGIDAPSELAEQEVPRRQGSVVQAARKKSRVLKVVGQVGGGACTPDQLQIVLDAIRGATSLETGPQRLFAGRDDRFWLAQRESYSESYQDGMMFGALADISMSFRAADPDAYGCTSGVLITETPTLGTSGSTNITPVGDSTAHPLWILTINATATGTVVLANALTGESCTVSGSFTAGDVITLDSREATYGAYKNGTVDYGIFSGPIPRLWPGVNGISVTLTTLALSAASVSYSPRLS